MLGARGCGTRFGGSLLAALFLDLNQRTLYNSKMNIPSKRTAHAMAKPMATLTLTLSERNKTNCS